jgi:hypothetical protein
MYGILADHRSRSAGIRWELSFIALIWYAQNWRT